MADIKPVITIESDFDPMKGDKVDFSRKTTDADGNQEITKCSVYLVDSDSSQEAFLLLLSQFKHA